MQRFLVAVGVAGQEAWRPPKRHVVKAIRVWHAWEGSLWTQEGLVTSLGHGVVQIWVPRDSSVSMDEIYCYEIFGVSLLWLGNSVASGAFA